MYEQKICYIDLYRNGVKCGNMGHVRVEWDWDYYRCTTSLCHMDRQTLVTAVLERTGGRPRTTIRNIAIIHGRGNAQFDWMPLEGDEESLLFQASGEVYGVCRLPKMRDMSGAEGHEVREREEGRQERAEQMREKTAQERTEQRMEKTAQERAEQRLEKTAQEQSDQELSGMEQHGLKQPIQEQTMQRLIQKQITLEVPKTASVEAAEREVLSRSPKSAEKLEVQKEEEHVSTGRGASKKPVAGSDENGTPEDETESVAVYPQNMEKRRRRERRVTTLSDDKWKQLCSIYPMVHPIGDDVDFVEITPADFVILRQEYQSLVRNSFLLHGYYNYNHILLGKYPDKYYIGVPGIMHEQERIAAAMFGFVGFERAKSPEEQKDNHDEFGYYMMEVGI